MVRRASEVCGTSAGWKTDEIIDAQVATIREQWDDAAEQCRLTVVDKQLLWGRLILSPGVFHDEDPDFDSCGS